MVKKIAVIVILLAITGKIQSMEDPKRTSTTAQQMSSSATDTIAGIANNPEIYFFEKLHPLLDQLHESKSANELLQRLNDALTSYQQIEDIINFTEGAPKASLFSKSVYIHLKEGLIPTFLFKVIELPIGNPAEFNTLINTLQRKFDYYYRKGGFKPLNLRVFLERHKPGFLFKVPTAPSRKRCRVITKKGSDT